MDSIQATKERMIKIGNRFLFFKIVDNEWNYFWHSANVPAPLICGQFIKYFEELLGVDVNELTTEERFLKLMDKKYPITRDKKETYYEFEEFISHAIIMFLENKIGGHHLNIKHLQ